MISVDTKPQNISSKSDKTSKEETPTAGLSFSDLLHGVSKKGDEKVVQNGAITLTLTNEKEKDASPVELNAEVTKNLSPEELKHLVKDAKNFLRDKIIQSDGFKKAEIASLPKTLKGLTQVAKKFGIDVSKITLEEVKISSKHISNKTDSKKIKNTPLFKVEQNSELTTEQLVHTKIKRIDTKEKKSKGDETLKMLLHGKTKMKNETSLTADFSVATARVIAPEITKDRDKSKDLESLLHGHEKHDDSSIQKTDGLNISKADSLEVKVNEAKQMTKYLSQDVKTAIDDYKSPFTKIKVQLNPQKLGEVDLTIVQRGKNLHINLSSNNAAINTLALNANDLKAQLTNNGINNASLNFNNNSQDQNQSSFGQQQQNSQQRQQARDEYNYFDKEEKNEELISSLEIIVPNYA